MDMTPDELIRRWVRPQVRALDAYHVPAAWDGIKLDAMENPYGWDDGMRDAWLASLRDAPLNRYPDASAEALRERLRAWLGLDGGHGLVLGNGSDELIQLVMMLMLGPGRSVLAPEPTFVMYRMIALALGLDFHGVPLDPDDFSLDRGAMLEAVAEHRPAVVFLAWPNNPTGNLFDTETIDAVIAASPGLVVIDEAYTAFSGRTLIDRLDGSGNVLILRTLSKTGLAGLRLGMLAGDRAWTDQIDKLRLPYNIGVLSQRSAVFALDHRQVFERQAEEIVAERSRLAAALQGMEGLAAWPSAANFILFRVPAGRADGIFDGLRQAGILIKNLHGVHAALDDCLRVTVGRPDENDAFLAALRGLV